MASSEAVHPWEQQEEEEIEEGLRIRRKSLIQTPLSTTINIDFKSNNGGSIGASNGEEGEQQEEKFKDFGHQNGTEVDEEDEKSREKEKQQRSDYLVYYDTDKGIWKCRVCSWDYQGKTCLTDHSQEPKRHSHMVVNVKSVDQQRLCFFNETKGTGLHFESSAVEADSVDCTTHAQSPVEENIGVTTHDQDNGNDLSSVIINQKGEHQDHNNFSTSRLQPSEISFEELDKNFVSYRNNIENADIEVNNDGNDEVTEYDVETILKKQETHDLYCPNCNSCITKRVILRKRKRRIRTPGEDAKRNKPETLIPSEANVVSDDPNNNGIQTGVYPSLDGNQPLASNEYDQQREPDVFRCLSCFSIFMPTGNGFKLFRIFGNKNDKQDNQCSQKEVRVKKGWLSSIFASDKELLTDQGACESLDGQNNVGGVSVLSSNPSEPNGLSSLTQEAQTNSEEGVFYPHHKTQEANTHTINGTTDLDDKPASDYVSSSNLNEPRGHVLEMNQGLSAIPSVRGDDNSPSSTQGSDIIEWTADKSDNAISKSKGGTATDSLEVDADDQLLTSYHIESNGKSDYPGMLVVKPPFNNVEPAEKPLSPLQHDGLKLLVPPNVGSLIIDNSQMNQNLNVTIQANGAGSDEKEKTSLSFSASDSVFGDLNLGGPMDDQELPANPAISGQEKKMEKQIDIAPEVSQQCIVQNNIEIHLEEPLKVDKDVLTDKRIKLHEDLKNGKRPTGKDTIITIESKQLDASAFQRSPDTPGMTGTSALHHVESGSTAMEGGGTTTTTTPVEGRSLDIVKSIVYGGLIESIASLSVVSSAAGADAATLNVLALGLANIFGGLFVISNDLWDLKNEATRGSSKEAPEHEERYQQLLGRKADFPLHMVVSLLSYLVFGLLPPTVYGFSFRVSNNRDLKLLMMAAASIACIMILAAGKAYVQRPRKSYFKTIAYYVTFGFMVSGVSYLFGDLIMKFLEKIDIFHSGSVVNLNIHGANSKPAIAMY